MTSYLYKPGHPYADAQGFVEKGEYYYHKFMTTEDKHMMVGNKRVEIYYNPDEMPETRHMVNGKYYTSKKKFRNETKARNCIEVGDEYNKPIKPREFKVPSRRQRREDIKRAIYELRNGRDIKTEILKEIRPKG